MNGHFDAKTRFSIQIHHQTGCSLSDPHNFTLYSVWDLTWSQKIMINDKLSVSEPHTTLCCSSLCGRTLWRIKAVLFLIIFFHYHDEKEEADLNKPNELSDVPQLVWSCHSPITTMEYTPISSKQALTLFRFS